MGVALGIALDAVQEAAGALFIGNPALMSLGIGRSGDGFGFVAVRNVAAAVPLTARLGELPASIDGIPIRYVDSTTDPVAGRPCSCQTRRS